jgi:hypothetical protein
MTWSGNAQRATIAAYFAVLAAMYGVAWFLPAIALDHDAAVNLVTAKAIAAGHGYVIDSLPRPIPQTQVPPFFPAVLALFTLISQNTLWLKLLPLAASVAWLGLTYRLLLRMGASKNGAMLLAGLTAASHAVIFLSTNLLPESLFALLVAASLLALLSERALLAGLLAGLATLTQSAGVALIAACVLTLLVRRRFRGAATLAVAATLIVAPWFGWSLAHLTHDAPSAAALATTTQSAAWIFTGLAANEKAVVLGANFVSVFASPVALLTGFTSVSSIIGTVLLLGGSLFVRRQTVPDLFLLFYSLILLCHVSRPELSIAPVLPLFLWIVWRALRLVKSRELLAAIVLIVALIPFFPDYTRIQQARTAGNISTVPEPANNWYEMRKVLAFARSGTAPESVFLSNQDGPTYLSTGRKTTRGFAVSAFEMFYAPRPLLVTPDQLSRTILDDQVSYLLVTPDLGLPESASFHRSVEALERGGVIEPVSIPGAARDYGLFRVARANQ